MAIQIYDCTTLHNLTKTAQSLRFGLDGLLQVNEPSVLVSTVVASGGAWPRNVIGCPRGLGWEVLCSVNGCRGLSGTWVGVAPGGATDDGRQTAVQ